MIKLNEAAIEYMQRLGFTDIILEPIKHVTWCDPPRMEMSVGFADKEETPNDTDERTARHSGARGDSAEFSEDCDSPSKDSSGRDLAQYDVEESVLGKVYIPREGVAITGPICVRYERHPWIEAFEIDGIIALRPKRKGYGTKDARGFVQSLNSIYAKAYDDYNDFMVSDATSGFSDNSVSSALSDTSGKVVTDPDCSRNMFDASGYFAHVTDSFAERFKNEGISKMLRKYCGFVENMWREGNEEMCGVAMNVVVPMMLEDDEIREIFTSQITDEFKVAIKHAIKQTVHTT